MRLTPIYHDGFSFYFDALAIAFTRDTDGRVTGFTMSGPRVRKVSFQRVERSR